jgi:hypothetical protein
MKNLILLIALVSSLSSVSANQRSTVVLEESDVALESITNGLLLSQERMCKGETNCFIDGEVVLIELPLGGCLDRLGPVTYVAKQVSKGKVELFVSAINIASSDSYAAFCVAMPSQIIEITLPNYFGKVELKFQRPLTRR